MPNFASPPLPLIAPEMIVLPGPVIVRRFRVVETGPPMDSELLELLTQDSAAWSAIGDVMLTLPCDVVP